MNRYQVEMQWRHHIPFFYISIHIFRNKLLSKWEMNIFKFMMKWCSFNQILRISNNTMLYFVNASNTQNENFVMKLFLTTQKIAHYDVNIIICNTMNIVDYQK